MSIESIAEQIRKRLSSGPKFGAKVKFDFGDDGLIFVDATADELVMNNEDVEADTTLICSIETFQKILDGTQDPNIAFMMGKLKIQGSMGYALKLNSILED
ncbi:MAG TPA: SCP-2 sterol transfer family protein [Rhodospirillaceae bacterium]|nr:SCP-2 sterol transfer family protein [Rhodospirillaceae bacterium]